ncbi:MAG: hypothetical protein M0P38_06290 [Bacteroidales bacterium]|jgi:adenine-specific DNA-methyltransferase|nr:hypothetical protein [Bacteroidales bacterium]
MNAPHSISLRNYLISNGYFSDIFHFNETPIFENVTISTIILNFVKDNLFNRWPKFWGTL